MNTAKKIYESDEQGVVHVDVPIGRPGHRVEVLVVWNEVAPDNDANPVWSSRSSRPGWPRSEWSIPSFGHEYR